VHPKTSTSDENHTKGVAELYPRLAEKTLQKFVTNSEHPKSRIKYGDPDTALHQYSSVSAKFLTVDNL
jgi:hypothetical protein